MFSRNVAWAAGILAAVALALVGYLAYTAAQKRAQQRQLAAMVQDTTEKLRQALAEKAAAELAEAIDANLKAARSPRDPSLADAAEHYLLAAREIVRRRVDADRLARQAGASRQALAGHMAHSGRRSDAWMRDAIALKKRVETDYFDLGISLKALDDLLFRLPDSEKLLEPRLGAAPLLEAAAVAAARKQAQADAQRAADELNSARRLLPQ